MIPWWAGLLLFFIGAFIGILLLALLSVEDTEDHKYLK